MNIALDTHRIVKRLMEAGFSDTQAETVTDVVRETHEQSLDQLATKADLAANEARLAARFEARFSELKSQMRETKSDILKWVTGLILVQGGVVVTLVKLLPGAH